jgi:peptidoglycan/LPS O-acetylase OafA/YrhL
MTLPAPKHRFEVLDGMRGAAAIMVVITHTTQFAPMAFLAVCFFFVLSGFVLAYGSGGKLQNSGPEGWRQKQFFAAGRLIRLYPLYGAGTAIALLPTAYFAWQHYDFMSPKVFAEALVAAPFFIPLPYDWSFPFDMPAWTLTFELVANAVFLFIGWRWVPTLVIVLIAGPAMLWDPGNSYWGTLAGELPVAMFCYFLGVALCRAWCENRLPKFGLHPLAMLAIICGLLAYPAANPVLYSAVLTVVVLPLVVWVGACSTATGGVARLMSWLGTVSFGVYMLHMPILIWVNTVAAFIEKFHPRFGARINHGAVLIVLPVSLVAAQVLTKHLDAPLRKWLWKKYHASAFGTRRVALGGVTQDR